MLESDVGAVLTASNGHRDRHLVARKFALMRTGPFPFLRGSCPLFYRAWPATPVLDSAPVAWISGDLHVENFGCFKGDNGLTYFDLNDFDEAVLAPATWDTARLLTSILVSAPTMGLNAPDAKALARVALAAYAAELRLAKPRWIERQTARGIVRDLLAQTGRRTRSQLLDRYTRRKGRRRYLVPDDRRVTAITDNNDRKRMERIVHAIADASPEASFFNVIDIAHRIAGNGALGVRRYVALVEGYGSPDHNALIDIKQELPSSVAPWSPVAQPMWHSEGERVCAIQHRAQAVSPALLRPALDAHDSFVIHELQPTADRMDLQAWVARPRKLRAAIEMFARLAAWAQVRTAGWHGAASVDAWLDFGGRNDWHKPLFERARAGAAQNARDYKSFSALYDAKAFEGLVRERPARQTDEIEGDVTYATRQPRARAT